MAAPGNGILISNPSEDQGPAVLAATLSVTSLALLAVLARLYVRFGIIRNLGWDDALMSFAMAISVAGQVLIIPEVHYGAGRHIGDIKPADYSVGMKLNFITQPLYLVCICLVKLAVGSTLLRIAASRVYIYLIKSIMCFMAFYTTGCFFTILFQCTDIRILWDPTITATCWGKSTLQALSYTNVALNILTDLCFAVFIPIPMLWKLNVNRRTRCSLILVLGLGIVACAAAVVKVGYLVSYGKLGDWLWDSCNITIWTVVECNLGIVAGSLPCLRPLLRQFLGTVYGSGSHQTGPTDGSANSRSGRRKFKNGTWQTLPSVQGPGDETSSERAFNAGSREEYELGDGGIANPPWSSAAKTTILSHNGPHASVDRAGKSRGITRKTTIAVTASDTKNP